MEAKFFSEIEKKMDIKTLKDFEKEVRTKIYNELEKRIRNEEYSWLHLNSDKKKKLYRLIDIYSNFIDIVDSVKELNTKVDRVKQLKEAPDDGD